MASAPLPSTSSAAALYQQQYLAREDSPRSDRSQTVKGRKWADELMETEPVRRGVQRMSVGALSASGSGSAETAGRRQRESLTTMRASDEQGSTAAAGSLSDLSTYIRRTRGFAPPPLVGASTTVVGDRLYVFGGRLVPTRIMISDLYALDLHTFVWERVWPLQEPASTRDKGKAKANDEASYIDDSPLSQRLSSPPPHHQASSFGFSPVAASPRQSVGSHGTAPDTPLSPGTLDAILAEDNPFEAAQRAAGPPARYFHSAEAWGDHHIVFFGGMGYTAASPSASRASSPTHPFRNSSASEAPLSPTGLQKAARGDPILQVLDDVFMFDVKRREWVFERPRCAKGVDRPTARYAHLSSLMEQAPVRRAKRKGAKVAVGLDVELEQGTGEVLAYGETLRSSFRRDGATEGARDARETGRTLLVLMGGQDMSNQYIRELGVLDLDTMTWTERKKFQGNYGTYRSVACAPRWTVRHQDPWASQPGEAEEGEEEEEELRRFSWSEMPTVDRPEPVYVYSNFNFNDVQRDLDVIACPRASTLKAPAAHQSVIHPLSDDMVGPSFPPGLRFPTGAVIGQHLVISGTYLTATSPTFSIWALNLSTGHASPSPSDFPPRLTWRKIEPGSVLAAGSWNRSCAWGDRLVVLGDRGRDLALDYDKRRLNFAHAAVVEMESSGVYQPPTSSASAFDAAKIGLSMLDESAGMGDLEIECSDGASVRCSRTVLSRRWEWFRSEEASHRERGREKLLELKTAGRLPPTAKLGGDGEVPGVEDARYDPEVLRLPYAEPIVLAFLEWLYAGKLLSTQRHRDVTVLAALLQMAETWRDGELKEQTVHALHSALAAQGPGGTDVTVAALVYQAATLSDCMPLQLRCLKAFYTPVRSPSVASPTRRSQ